jgi:hypothetical protein
MTKAHMKRLLSPKVLHPRPQRPVHQPIQLSSPAAASRAHRSSAAPAMSTSSAMSMSSSMSMSSASAEPPVLALGDHAHEHERELEHSFFAAGLSEDSLRAISERQREQVERELPAGRAPKVVFGFAMCAGLLLVSGFVGTKVIGGANRPGAPSVPAGPAMPPPLAIPPAAAEPAPAAVAAVVAAPAPVAALVFGPELPPAGDETADQTGDQAVIDQAVIDQAAIDDVAPAVAAPMRTVSVADLRARPVPEPEADPQTISAAGSTGDADELTAARAERVTAAAAAATEDPREACGEQLRRGEFRNIKESCSVAFEAQPDAQLATEVARAALDDKRNREAAAWARKAIAVDASFADAFVYLGAAENELGHSQAAREAYGRYLQLEPRGEQAENVRAIIENL